MFRESDSEGSRSSSSSSSSYPPSPSHSRRAVKTVTSNPRVEVGAPCLHCGDGCEGLLLHVWRKICINCQCPREHHKATTGPSLYADKKDGGAISLSDYAWFPSGISPEMVKLYMESIPAKYVPLRGSQGEKLRHTLHMKQLPPHDTDPELCHAMTDKERKRLTKFHDKFKSRACGVGTVHHQTAQPVGATISKLCAECNESIDSGHIYITADKHLPSTAAAWHSSCFTCTTCNEMLVDLTYFFNDKDNRLYCGRHYAEANIARCFGCDELIVSDTYTNAEDKMWHKEHFCCHRCDKLLFGEKYFHKNDNILCHSCFDRFADDCHRCHLPIVIGSKKITKGDLLFHEECFVCKRCRESLHDRKYYFAEDDYLCNECFQPASQCFSCKEGILPIEKHFKYESRTWHIDCFVCISCKETLVRKGFHDYAGSLFCTKCYSQKTSKRCNNCQKPITGKGIQFNFCVYHPECFKCSECRTELREKISEKQGHLYCQTCSLKFAKICKSCQKPISSRHMVHDGNVYHSQCFKCTQCGYPIGNQTFYETSLKDVLCEPCAGRDRF